MERTESFTTWLRVVISAALAITLGTFIGGASSPVSVVQAADVAPETNFEIDGNATGPFDFVPGYGPGTTAADGYATTGLYYNVRSYDNGLVPSPSDPRPGCNIDGDVSTVVGGVKLGDGPVWPSPSNNDPNGKTDLNFIDLAAEKVDADGEIFDILYVGYEKCGGTGTWQAALYLDDGDGVLPSEGDADGDYLFIFDFAPSTGIVTFKQFRRVGGAWSEQFNSNVFIEGSASGDYGEVALNITELVFANPDDVETCKSTVVSGPATSLTGGSLTSQPKDLVDFPSLRIDNCGPLNVAKVSGSDDTTTAFDYVVDQSDADGAATGTGTVHGPNLGVTGVVPPGSTLEPDGNNEDIVAEIGVGNTHAWTNVISSPDYLLEETLPLPTGWELESIVCTVPDLFGADPYQTVEVVVYENGAYTGNEFVVGPTTLGNVVMPAASCEISNDVLGITIVKDGVGTAGTEFDFNVAGAGTSIDTSAIINGDSVFVTVPAVGPYTITEADINLDDPTDDQPDWSLTDIVCTDGTGTTVPVYNVLEGTATVVVDSVTDDIVCTFTNEQASRIIVEKVTDPDTGDTFDFDVVGPDTVALDGIGNGGSDNTGDITPGDYTITEDLTGVNVLADPDWVLTSVDCGSGDETITNGNAVSVGVAAGEVLTCTFNNQQQGSISIDKQIVDPGTTDVVTDQDATFSFEGAVSGDITTTAGVTANGDALTSNPVMPGSYTVTEDTAATPGYTLESVDCTDPTGDSVQNGDGADIELGSGEAVSCTFTNSRNQATFTLQKQWGDGTLDGEVVDLDASAAGPAPLAAAIDTTATSPAGAAGTNTMTVYSGQTVTLSETFQVAANGDAYTTSLNCGTLPAGMTLTPATGNRSATLTVGNDPADVTCTFTNTPKTAGVALQKNWAANSNVGDDVVLSVAIGLENDQATSVAAEAPEFVGPNNADDNTAFLPVVAGQTVTLGEISPGVNDLLNYGTPVFDCPTATNDPVEVDPYEYTLLIDPADVSSGETIFCSFTNTRIEVDLVLEKDWVDAKVLDAVTLSATGSDTTPISYASTAETATETDTSGTFTVYAGETLTLAETWVTGDPAAYDTELVCVGATDTDPSDGLDIAPGDSSITCTWENTRRSVEVQVAKDVRPDGDNGTFSVTLNDIEVLTNVGDGDDVDPDAAADETSTPVTILVGDLVELAETATGPVGIENYTSTLACDNGITPANNDGVSGDFVVPSTLDSNTLITCTFVNTRNEAPITLTKSWGTSPADGDLANLDITGGLGTVTPGVHSNDGGLDVDQDATSTAYAGETLTLEELLGAEYDASWYDITLVCSDSVGQFVIGDFGTVGQETTGSITVPSDPTAITCEFTNQRKSATLVVDKYWLQAQVGDTADITAAGIDPGSPAEGTATVDLPTETDPAVATLTVWVGETVDVSEVVTLTPPDDAPRYDTTLVCDGETDVIGRAGTVTVDPDEQDTTLTCTFRNVRRGANVLLSKSWADSPQNGDAVDLSISGGLIDPTVTAPEATNSNDGDDANDVDAVARGLVGETLTLAEVFIGGDAANYDTDFECLDGQGALLDTEVTYVDGALTATLDITADLVGPVSCEYTNTRKRADFELQKTWLGSVEDDSVELTVDSTSNAAPVDALAPGGDGDSTEVVATTVYAGETLTVSELIDPDGINEGVYDPTDFTCIGTATGTVAPDGLSSELTVTAAEVDAANLADATISCEFENSAQRGNIVIVKSIDGTTDGEFDFAGDWSADGITTDPAAADPTAFSILTDGLNGSVTFNNVLVPKDGEPYSIVETDPTPEYDGTEVVCSSADADDTSSGGDTTPLTGSIDLDNGETVTCTFTNTERSTIVIVKDADPDSAADFAFTGDLGTFTLDDDADGTLSNTFTSDLLNAEAGSTYTVNETPTPGWTLDLAASSCTNGDTFAGAGVVIDPDPGTTVTCTFVNTANPAGLTATKAVSGVEGAWGPFTFTLSGGTFTGDAAQDVDSTDPVAQWTNLVEGQTYTIVENEVPGYETGAEFACTLIDPNDPNNPVDLVDGSADDGFQFTAVAGGIYSCDITNVAIPPTLVVEKTTVGGTGVFTFDVTPTDLDFPVGPLTADTTVTNPASTATVDLQAGVGYTVAEQLSDAWVEGPLTCTVTPAGGTETPYTFGTITQPGDEISCEITNTRRAQIVTEKTTVPAEAAGDFGFEASWNGAADGVADFTLADGGSNNSGFLDPGVAYTVTELAAPGFALTDVQCDSDTGIGSVDTSSATITPAPGEIVTCEFTNSQRGPVTIAKDAVTDITRDGTTYSVTYEITVSSESYIDELFDLTDSPDMAPNVTVTSMVVNGPGVTDHDIVADGELIVDDGTIPARAGQADGPDALVYTVVTTFTMTPSNSSQECVDGQGGNGAYNSATVTFEQPPTTNSDDACVDLPTPDISVEKVADGALATQVAGFQYQAVYTVTVTNDGEGPGSYTIADLPAFPDGATVDDVTLSPEPDPVSNVLEAGGEDVYTVTVLFTVDGELDLELRTCGTEPTPGQGGYNGVTVTYGPTPDPTSEACVNIPDPNIGVTKVRTSDTATLVGGTVYSATYTVTVSNTGSGPGAYSVLDVPVVAGDGVISTTIVPEPAAITAIEAGGSDVYTVTVLFDVPGDLTTDERTCVETRDEAGSGAYNGVTVTWNGEQTSTDEDCVDIPNPNVEHDKVVVGDGAVYNGDNNWTVTYDVTVTNLDPDANDGVPVGPSQYTLTDSFDFGPGATVNSVTVTPNPDTLTVNGAFDGDGDTTLATDVLIEADGTHTYTITVDVDVVPTEGTNGDCTTDGGFRNAAGITVASDGETGDRADQEACAPFSVLTLVKVVVNDDGGEATADQFTLTATLDSTEILSGDTVVTESVPAGDYVLAETQLAGYTTDGFTCGEATMNGQTVTVADGASVTCTIVNDDEPVDLEITKNDDGVTAIAGGAPFDYTITVQNVGTRDADLGEPVTVVDELPLPLQWVSFPDNCVQAGQTLTCDIDPALMTAGGDPVVITATVSAPADAASGTYVNEASVTTEDDPVCEPIGDCEPPPCEEAASNNNIDCEPTPVDREGAIQIVKTDNVAAGDSVLPGEQYNYTLRVTNTGVSTILPGLVVTDDLPAQLSLVSVSGGTGWTCNNADPIECTYAPSLAPGASAPNITVVVSVNADATGTEIDNTAVVQGAVDRECPEPTSGADLSEAFVPACNQVTDDDDETTPLTAQADLAIDKTASVATVGAGGGFNWVLVVENLGPAPAIDVVVGDLVPSAVTVTGVTSSFFDCSRSGNDVTCTRPEMAVGASGTITIAVTVPTNAEGGNVDNLGRVEASTPDPNLDNNSDDATVVVVAQIPPTSVAPTIPATGSNSTEPVVKTAMVLLMLGALGLVAARRRRPDGVTPTA